MSPGRKPIIVKFANGAVTKEGIEKIQLDERLALSDQDAHEDNPSAISDITVKVDDISFCGKKFDSTCSSQSVVFLWNKKQSKYVPQIADTYTLIPDIYSTLEKSCSAIKNNETASAVEVFGSTQVKKTSKLRKKRTDISAASANTMKDALPQLISNYQDSITQFIDDRNKNKVDSVILPPRNPNAQDVSEIYDIDSIFPKKVRKHLIGTIDEFRQWLVDSLRDDPKSLPVFIYQSVRVVPDLETLDDTNFFTLLIYWYYLLEFYGAIKKKTHISYVQKTLSEQISKKVLKHLTREFTSDGGTVNNLLLTKCLCYLTLVALYISKFSLDCMPLIQDLCIPVERLRNILKEIGCDVSYSNFSSASSHKRRKRKLSLNKGVNTSTLETDETNESTGGGDGAQAPSMSIVASLRLKIKKSSNASNADASTSKKQ